MPRQAPSTDGPCSEPCHTCCALAMASDPRRPQWRCGSPLSACYWVQHSTPCSLVISPISSIPALPPQGCIVRRYRVLTDVHLYSDANGFMLQLKLVEEYMRYHKLPRKLKVKVRNYFYHRYHGRFFNEKSMLKELSHVLEEASCGLILGSDTVDFWLAKINIPKDC